MGLRFPISLAPRLQTDQLRELVGTVFEKPLLDHLNGELCPPPQDGPSVPLLRYTLSRLSPSPLPASQAHRLRGWPVESSCLWAHLGLAV